MKQDRRVKYTQMVLKEALLEILQDRPIERISVKEICDRADVNRSTFYVHYGSPMELLDSIKDDMYDEIKSVNTGYSDMLSFLTGVFDIMYKHRRLLKLLTRGMAHMDIMLRIFDLWKDDFKRAMMQANVPEDKWDTAYLFVSCGTSAMICVWAMGESDKTSRELAEEVYSLVTSGINGYIKEADKHV
jgi:AcrR family transcriptional regulator